MAPGSMPCSTPGALFLVEFPFFFLQGMDEKSVRLRLAVRVLVNIDATEETYSHTYSDWMERCFSKNAVPSNR